MKESYLYSSTCYKISSFYILNNSFLNALKNITNIKVGEMRLSHNINFKSSNALARLRWAPHIIPTLHIRKLSSAKIKTQGHMACKCGLSWFGFKARTDSSAPCHPLFFSKNPTTMQLSSLEPCGNLVWNKCKICWFLLHTLIPNSEQEVRNILLLENSVETEVLQVDSKIRLPWATVYSK